MSRFVRVMAVWQGWQYGGGGSMAGMAKWQCMAKWQGLAKWRGMACSKSGEGWLRWGEGESGLSE